MLQLDIKKRLTYSERVIHTAAPARCFCFEAAKSLPDLEFDIHLID